MSQYPILIAVLAAAALVALAGIALWRRRHTTAEIASPEVRLDPIVGNFVEAVHRCASESDELYVQALALLRQNPDQAARQIEIAYKSVSSTHIRARESLLFAAAALAHRSALPVLSEVAHQPVNGTMRHDGGRAAEESVLRLIAVDGIEAIARTGDADAADLLVALVASSDRAVQAAAVVALKYMRDHRGHYEKLRSKLPPERLFLLDIVRSNVRDVPQVADPRRHLLSEPATADARPDLRSGNRRNVEGTRQYSRVPQAHAVKD